MDSRDPAAQPKWPWPDELDAMVAAPASHRRLFENEHVRYLEVIIRPGDFVPLHTHRWPSVVYVQSTSEFIRRDGEGRVLFDSARLRPCRKRRRSNGWRRCRPIPWKMSAHRMCISLSWS